MKNRLLTLLMLLALVLFVAACGGGTESETTSDETESVPAESGEEEAEPAEEEMVEEVVDPNAEPTPIVNAFGDCDDPLILWHGLTGTDGAVFAEMLENYINENPGTCLSALPVTKETI